MDHFIAHAVNARQAADLDLGARCEKSHWAERNLTRWEPPAARSRTGPRRFLSEHLQSAAGTVGSSDRRMTREMTRPRILLTNDDGIDAPGLAALLGACEARRLSDHRAERSALGDQPRADGPPADSGREARRRALGARRNASRLRAARTHAHCHRDGVGDRRNQPRRQSRRRLLPLGDGRGSARGGLPRLSCDRHLAVRSPGRRPRLEGSDGPGEEGARVAPRAPSSGGALLERQSSPSDDDDADAEVVFCSSIRVRSTSSSTRRRTASSTRGATSPARESLGATSTSASGERSPSASCRSTSTAAERTAPARRDPLRTKSRLARRRPRPRGAARFRRRRGFP